MPRESPRLGIAAVRDDESPSTVARLLDSKLATLAHEINNPLAVIVASLDFAIEEIDTTPEPGGDMGLALQDAREAAERIRFVVAQMTGTPVPVEKPPVSSVVEVGQPEPASAQKLRANVLVVDDEPSVGSALTRSLRDHDVVVTGSGYEALRRCARGEKFDIILCDVMMPGMTGFDLYEEVERVAPDQADRMIFLTGGAATPEAAEFVASVPNLVIQKPFDVSKIRELIRSRRPRT